MSPDLPPLLGVSRTPELGIRDRACSFVFLREKRSIRQEQEASGTAATN